MKTLQVTHLVPGSENHLQAVLENLHYTSKIKILEIRFDNNEKYVDYEEVLEQK
jgi:hypothetical protein